MEGLGWVRGKQRCKRTLRKLTLNDAALADRLNGVLEIDDT